MQSFHQQIQLQINSRIYHKDPFSSVLGKKILSESILMIDELGLEQFTFKKLAFQLGTVESSIYRYFDSKHKLLIYLTSWYWAWIEYRVILATSNITDNALCLRLAMEVICKPLKDKEMFVELDFEKLLNIVISESSKAYLTKEVDTENKEGFFSGFKQLCKRMVEIAQKINPEYPYPHTLITTMLEAAHHQRYFAAHLPTLSDANTNDKLLDFITQSMLNSLNPKI